MSEPRITIALANGVVVECNFEDAARVFTQLTDRERIEVMSCCCRGCGRLWTRNGDYCHCENDE